MSANACVQGKSTQEETLEVESPLAKLSTEDLYVRLKTLQRQLDFIAIQEDYIKDEQKNLKREFLRAQEEIKRIQSVPLVIGQFFEMIDPFTAIVGSTIGAPCSPFSTSRSRLIRL